MVSQFDPVAAAGGAPILAGKHIAITGVGGAVGSAAAELFTRAGATVFGSDVSDGALARLDGSALGGLDIVDIVDEGAVDRWITDIEASGPLDGVFHAAGVVNRGSFTAVEHTLAEWDRMISANLTGTFVVLRAAMAHLGERGGSLVSVSSSAGLVGYAGSAGYVAAKTGIVGLTRGLALEGGPLGIRVNTICPGALDTPMLRDFAADAESLDSELAAIVAAHPLGRLGLPEEVAAAAAWLLSDASSFVSGVALPVDGGAVAG